FEQIKSRLPFSSTSTKGRGRSNIHLTPIDRLPFQALKSRSAKCTTFSLAICAWREFAGHSVLRFSYETTVLHDVFCRS
ncbi:hypothetical protein JG688_00002763, partial [Phytophthora aleatoria]